MEENLVSAKHRRGSGSGGQEREWHGTEKLATRPDIWSCLAVTCDSMTKIVFGLIWLLREIYIPSLGNLCFLSTLSSINFVERLSSIPPPLASATPGNPPWTYWTHSLLSCASPKRSVVWSPDRRLEPHPSILSYPTIARHGHSIVSHDHRASRDRRGRKAESYLE
jgi:hypothetical protein